ncbi:hypothetical protein TMU01_03870 [Tenuibacillus multivorans]|uniref:Heptaprenyl diphosphate synthase (HEPPP synthase) subunit 1 n=1 Tax=Tenuibacillus multivorans TaxID=237069 RepID=A0A1H0CV22_9BACI|nr:heptaprenyl diphosphate synthase component 1 [Tenuibacillus multivorans]GEL76152.1 hypothetical protein TMU01_03870 [Tenuibacillus multivorans]SDN61742.1 Heptaprenyl diphosphate synthase (HEPPP synthase) subunit 1 [Tenuibacillus multivorans]
MYLKEKIENIRQDFISTYKHPYTERQFYDGILSYEQILCFKDLLLKVEINQNHREKLFVALLHMQISLDIHDQVDLENYERITDHRSVRNQLRILVGDYHSSYFYSLLSQYNMLDELYHFIEMIKHINESKMTILHNQEQLTVESLLKEVENVHCGLYNALSSLYRISDYQTVWKPKIVHQLVYNRGESKWLDVLKNNNSIMIDNEISKREKFWSPSDIIGDN